MTNAIKLWSMRAIVAIVLSFLAYTGGSLLEQATATAEVGYCENDRCAQVLAFGMSLCIESRYSHTGCNRTSPSGCETYACPPPVENWREFEVE